MTSTAAARIVGQIVEAMDDRGMPALDARILVVGVATEPDVADPVAVDVIVALRERGAWVVHHDPLVERLTGRGLDLPSVPLDANRVRGADCVVLLTRHATIDPDGLTGRARLLVDAQDLITE